MSAFRFVRRLRRPSPSAKKTVPAGPRLVCLEDRTNPGPLTFSGQPNTLSTFTQGTSGIVRTGDFNGDGFEDYAALLTTGIVSSKTIEVGVSRGTTNNGTFLGFTTDTLDVPVPAIGSQFGLTNHALAVADVVGPAATGGGPDGFADVIAGAFEGNALYIFRANGDGTFQTPSKVTISPGFPAASDGSIEGLAAGDLNADGKADLFVSRSDTVGGVGTAAREYSVLLGNGAGGFAPVNKSGTTGFAELRTPRIVDVDADGKADVVTYDGAVFGNTAAVLWGLGDGKFADAARITGPSGTISAVNAGDFDGNGRLDLVVGYDSFVETLDVYFQSKSFPRSFTSSTTVSLPPAVAGSPTQTADIAVGDFDFDGADDFVVGKGFSRDVSMFLGSPTRVLTTAPGSPFLSFAGTGVAVADFDDNQLPDFFSNGWGSVLRGAGVSAYNQLFLNKTLIGGEVTLADSTDTDTDPTTIGTTFYRVPFTVSAKVSQFIDVPTGTFDFFLQSQDNSYITPTATGLTSPTPFASVPLAAGAAAVTFDSPPLAAALRSGVYTVSAVYRDGNYPDSPLVSLRHQVVPANTSIQIDPVPPATVVFGQVVTLTGSVQSIPSASGIPAGTVAIFDNGNLIGSAAVDPATGQFSFPPADDASAGRLAIGVHPLTLSFVGNANFGDSETPEYRVEVTRANSVLSLAAVPRATTFGDPVALTATVAVADPNGGISPGVVPPGSVTFLNGGTVVGTAAIGANGKATFNLTGLNVGTYTLSAQYLDNQSDEIAGSTSNNVQVTVAPTTSAMTLSAAPETNRLGGTLVLSANVTDLLGRPVNVGTVAFSGVGPDGRPLTGLPADAAVVDGVATANVTGLGLGDASFFASFSGTDSISPATASPVTITTDRAIPGFTFTNTAGGTSVPLNKDVTFTATFTPPTGLAAPGGTVVFSDNGTAFLTTTLDANGAATFTTRLPVGPHTITAAYAGDATFEAATFTTDLTVVRLPETFAVGAAAPGGDVLARYTPAGAFDKNLFAFGPDAVTGVRVATGDLNGDGVPDIAVATGPGAIARVRVLDGVTGAPQFEIFPFEQFQGGVFVTVGDVNGDLRPDLIITPDEGGGPRVRVFSGNSYGQIADYFAIEDANFRGGARAGTGDVNNDGVGDLIVAAGFGGGPRVSVWDGRGFAAEGVLPRRLFNDFFAFDPGLRNGVYVAGGDVNGDGFADLVVGAGPGGGPRVIVVSGRQLVQAGSQVLLASYFAGNPNDRGGVPVAVRNLDGDSLGDVVVGSAAGSNRVTAYAGSALRPTGTPAALFTFDAFQDGSNPEGGVFVG